MKKQYQITAPVANFCGVGAAGVHFAYGKAIVTEGWVADWYREKGYDVKELPGEKTATKASK